MQDEIKSQVKQMKQLIIQEKEDLNLKLETNVLNCDTVIEEVINEIKQEHLAKQQRMI